MACLVSRLSPRARPSRSAGLVAALVLLLCQGRPAAAQDPLPTLSISSPSVTEGAPDSTATLTFQVTLSAASTQTVSVVYSDARMGTATVNQDYAAFSTQLVTFAAGETSHSFEVTVTGDALHESNETVVVTLRSPTNATIATGTGTGTITDDDDAPTVTLTLGRTSIREGGGGITWVLVRARLSAASAAATTVTVSAAAGTDADSSDFSLSANKTLTIAAGQTASTGEVRIDAVDNAVQDPDRQVTVSGAASNSIGGFANPADVTLTIEDDEAPPKPKLVLSRSTIGESGTNNSASVTATMTPVSERATTITVSAAPGGGADSSDFTLSANKTLTIAAGDSTSTGAVTVTAVDNALDAPNKQVTVSATASNSLGATNPDDVTLTIEDDDASSSLSISSPSVAEGAQDSTAALTFVVKLSPASGQRVSVKYGDARTGTAAYAQDYVPFGEAILRFAPGDTLKSFDVTVKGDGLHEPNETVVVQLSQPVHATIGTATGTGTITDDEATPTVTLTLGRASIREGGGGITWTQVRATQSAASAAATTIVVSAAPGTGADSSDFTLSANKTLTIAAGQTTSTGTVRIDAVDNGLDEPNKQVAVSGAVTNSVGGYANPDDLTLTIEDDEATPKPTLVLSRSTIGESGTTSSASVTATMSPASVQATTITVSAAPGTDADSSDFSLSANKTLTIAAGDTTSTGAVTVSAVDNGLDEPNKQVTVSATASNSQGATDPDDVTLTIQDDDATPSLSISSPSVAEGATDSTATLTFQVKLSAASGQQVGVVYGDARSGTATVNEDYAAFPNGILRFAAGDTLKSFAVTVKGDSLHESDETVVATLRSPTNATIATATGTGTITDDEATPTVTLSLGRASIREGGTAGFKWTDVRATQSGVSAEATTITVSAAPGTGADSSDFSLSANKTLTIPAGQTTSTGAVRIDAVDNAVDDPNRQVTVSGAASNSIGGVADPADVTLTIQDDEATPKVTLVLSRSTIDESGTNNSASVTATMSPASVQATTITVSAAPGTGADSSDFSLSANKTLTIAAGDSTSTGAVTVSAVDDALDAPNKQVTVSATASNSQGATNPDDVTLTIEDDDAAASLSISSPSVAEGAQDSTAALTFQVKLSPASGQQVSVKYGDARTGTAAHAQDYVPFGEATLRFAPGDTLKSLDVTVKGDGLHEPNETVVVQLSQPAHATIGTATGTGTITDDETTPTVTLTLGRASIREGGGGITWTQVRATQSGVSAAATTVAVSAAPGTDADSSDFTLSANKTLTIAAGQTTSTGTVRIDAVDNGLDEPNKQVAVSGAVTNSVGGYANPDDLTLTIEDDEATPKPTLVLSRSTIGESGTTSSASVTATMSPASVQATTITVSAAPGTDADSSDFSLSANKTLTIAAGDTTSTGAVTVSAVDNGLDEPNKQVTVSATASNSQGATDPDDVTLTIQDDDATPSLSLSSPSVAEGAAGTTATLTFQVKLSAASGQQVAVVYGDARSGTAAVNQDYDAFADGTATFAAGDTLKSFDVTVRGDGLDEPNETVVAKLRSPSNATIATATGTGTITDDEAAPTVTLALALDSIREGGTGFTWTEVRATQSAASAEATTIAVSAAPGTGADSSDFRLSANKTLTIAAGQTTSTGMVRVDAVDNGLDEPNRQVTVSGAASNSIGGYANPADKTLTIEDDEGTPKARLVLSRSTIGESGTTSSAAVTATMSPASVQATTITVSAAPGTGADSSDFSVSANKTLTIAAGDSTSTGAVTVSAVDNGLDEPNKQVTVSATASNSQGATDPDDVTLTIEDDDAASSLSVSSPSVTEGGSGTTTVLRFTLRLSPAATERVTVDYADAGDGTATPGADYEPFGGGTLTFEAGETLRTIAVTVLGDDQEEDDETVVLALSGAVNARLAAPRAAGTIADDDAPPPPALVANSPAVREGDDGFATLSWRVSLLPPSENEVRLDYADAGTGTAESGVDYLVVEPGTLVFAPGDTIRTIQARVVGDHANEPDETVVIALSNARGAPLLSAEATGTIEDDDPSVLSVDSPQVQEGDAGDGPAVLVFAVALTPPSYEEVVVAYADNGAGTATPEHDYQALEPGRLSFAPGDTLKTVRVTVAGDDLDEPDETVVLQLDSAANANITQGTGTGTIVDDDGPPTVTLDSPSVVEGGPGERVAMRFAVRLDAPSAKPVEVDLADTGTGTAEAGADYEAVTPARLSFAPGDTVHVVEVTVRGDALDEPDETILVALADPSNAELPADGATGAGTILDDDRAPALSVDSPAVEEGGPGEAVALVFAVSLSAPTGKTVAVDYADAGTGTAEAGADYEAVTPARLLFAPGDTVRVVEVTVRGDALDEPDETVLLALADPVHAELPADGATGAGTILDDDDPPTLSVESPSVKEGDDGVRPLAFRFRLDRPSGRSVTLGYADEGAGTATPGADYEEVPAGTLDFEPGETLKVLDVQVLGDTHHEPDETVVLRLSTPDPTIADAVAEVVAGTIENDDPDLVPSFGDAAVPPQRWLEGRAIRPLSLPPAQGGNPPVTYALSPALPPGLAFDAERRTISGTPGAGRPATTYRWVATDQDGDSAALTFTAEVVAIQQIRARLEEINRAILPEVARTWADVVSNAVAGRVAQTGRAGAGAGAWGHGEYRRLASEAGRGEPPVDWSGDVHALGAGADVGLGASVTLGAGATRMESVLDYTHQGEGRSVSGRHEGRLVGVNPYLGWSGAGGSRAWTTAGYAKADVVIRDDEAGTQTAAGRVRMLAAGAAVRVFAGAGGGRVDAKGEGHVAQFRLDDNGDLLGAVDVGVHRLRFALHAERSFRVGSGRALKPSVALGVRQDGGDGRTGTGVEAGGGVSASAWNSRLQVEAAARTLLVHGAGLAEWGAGGSLRIAPGADGGGLSLRVQPGWGVPQDGIGQLWSEGVTRRPGLARPRQGESPDDDAPSPPRLDVEMAWGVGAAVFGTESLLTPYAALGPDPRGLGKAYRFGVRLTTAADGGGLGVGLEAARPGAGLRLQVEYNR